jgi:hypothetical protein
MEELLAAQLQRLGEIIAGIPLDYGSIPEDRRESALLIALHCCLNGPVGVNKQTTFPVVGPAKIKDLLGCTNSSWKGFCSVVATLVTRTQPRIDCSQYRQHHKYWPL